MTILTFLTQDAGQFTRARDEHIIVEIERPFRVRSVSGIVVLKGEAIPIAKTLLEIQGAGRNQKIRRTVSDESGRFRFRRVSPGTYRFKATLNGMQSVMGTIVVVRNGETDQEIRIEMLYGV